MQLPLKKSHRLCVSSITTNAVPKSVPSLYLQHLQVKEKEPNLSEEDDVRKAQLMEFLPSSPIQMSKSDIDEVLSAISSSDIYGHAQPIETPPSSLVFYCFCCGQAHHASFQCLEVAMSYAMKADMSLTSTSIFMSSVTSAIMSLATWMPHVISYHVTT